MLYFRSDGMCKAVEGICIYRVICMLYVFVVTCGFHYHIIDPCLDFCYVFASVRSDRICRIYDQKCPNDRENDGKSPDKNIDEVVDDNPADRRNTKKRIHNNKQDTYRGQDQR